jgi:hypothetical protein
LSTALWTVFWHLAGVHALAPHAVTWILYVLTAALVGWAAYQLTGDRLVAPVAAGLFGAAPVHAEPVLWLSASNEILSGFCALVALNAYLRWHAAGGRRHAVTAAVAFVLALGAKETAVFLPAWLLVHDRRRTGTRPSKVALSCLAVSLAFVVARLRGGSPYPIAPAVPMIPVNTLYYLAVGFLGVPEHYGYRSELPLWLSEPALPLLTVTASLCAAALLLWRGRDSARPLTSAPMAGLATAWIGIAVLPVALIATGRTFYLASVGVAWLLAFGVRRASPAVGIGVLSLLFLGYGIGVSERTTAWHTAGETTHRVIAELAPVVTQTSPGTAVCVSGLPDHHRHAYLFRNGLPPLAALLWPTATVIATSAADTTATECAVRWTYRPDR